MEILLAKTLGLAWDLIKGLVLLVVGWLTWRWRKQEAKVEKIDSDLTTLKAEVVTLKELDSREAKIMHKVESEHQRIIDVLEKSLQEHQNKLITCNENVMAHVEVLRGDFKEAKSDIKEVRNFMMNHLERRQTEKD